MAKFRTIERWVVTRPGMAGDRPVAMFHRRASAREYRRIWHPEAPAPVKVRIEAVNPRDRAPKAARRGRTR